MDFVCYGNNPVKRLSNRWHSGRRQPTIERLVVPRLLTALNVNSKTLQSTNQHYCETWGYHSHEDSSRCLLVVTPCSNVRYQRFGRPCCLYLQGEVNFGIPHCSTFSLPRRPLHVKSSRLIIWYSWGSILGGGWEFFSPPPCTERLWSPPSLLSNGYNGLFPWG
jgi:hypothetical protein